MTALFPESSVAVSTLRQFLGQQGLAGSYLAGLGDDVIWSALVAAEADAERALRVFFEPVVVLPESATPAERAALTDAGRRWTEEPGYDLEDELFAGERWGYLVMRQRPVIQVDRVQLVYPLPTAGIFTVPPDWIRLDKKYGHLRVVPGSQSFAAPLSIGVLQALGGGRGIPQALHIRYVAGLEQAASRYPDLVDLVRRMAVLRLLQMQYLPTSASISADGLSESMGIDLAKYGDDINARLERLRQAIHGIQVSFLV